MSSASRSSTGRSTTTTTWSGWRRCSPSHPADALAVDRWRQPRIGPSVRHGMPIRIAWLLIGSCYFFPGLAKAVSGHWFDPENGQWLLDVQRWAAGLPPLHVSAPILVVAAAATVAFEVGFVFLVFSRFRTLAVAMAVAFHLSTFVLMGILALLASEWVDLDLRTA